MKISDLDVTRSLSNYGKEWTHQKEKLGKNEDLKSWATSLIFLITGESIHWHESTTHPIRCEKMKASAPETWRPEILQELASYNRATSDKLLMVLESGILSVQFDFMNEFKSY